MGTADRGRLVRRLRRPRGRPDLVAAAVVKRAIDRITDWSTLLLLALIVSIVVFGYFDRKDLLQRNCRQIELLKQQIREETRFDQATFRQALTNLEIDPDSERGQRLIEASRARAQRTQERFKPLPC
jgi:hypothetical protein